MIAKAQGRFLRRAPRKLRKLADLIRGKNVEEALNILQFTPKYGSRMMARLLKSAVSNADQRQGVNVDKLYVSSVKVDGGPAIKRFRPRAMGRATGILKKTSHVTLTLDQRS
jgi:large subunit ribosomal protein L22